jgi:hypothetical protein
MRGACWVLLAAGCDEAVRVVGPGTGGAGDDTPTPYDTGSDTGYGGEGGGGGGAYSCDRIDVDGTCTAYLGNGWDEASRQNDCGVPTVQGACPSGDLGGCRYYDGQPLEFVESFYAGTYYSDADLDFLSASCELNSGVWMP